MLKNKVGKKLYYEYAEKLPIIDYHCHISPKMIAEDYRFNDAYELFLGGDHYKWRQMRSCGIDEKYITGDGEPYEKWLAFASVMPNLIGNPLYHWTHLELKRYFDIDKTLNKENAKYIWDAVNEKLKSPDFSVKGLIKKSNVEAICTTDNPYDSLEYHKQLKNFETKVIPAFRPDLYSLKPDITERMDFFHENGCRLSDHAV
jgi:glucuronate isomerase